MNVEEFQIKYSGITQHTHIKINCDECNNEFRPVRWRAENTIKKNNCYLCRSCGLKRHHRLNPTSKETKQKQREGRLGKIHSNEAKKKMSDAKKAFFKTEAGKEAKRKLSILTAKGHAANKYENAKRQGWFPSQLNDRWMFYGSSYELRFCYILESDKAVESYDTQIGFNWNGRGRCLDFLIKYKNGTTKAVEVKPEDRLTEQKFIDQIKDSREYAESNQWLFEVCTEKTLGMTYQEIRNWSDEYRKTITGIDYTKHRLEMDRKKAKKHYDTKIAQDKIEVFCEYCQAIHNPLKLTYEKNIARNGKYICEREGGFIAGSKPKKKKENPYASEGKKQCNGPCGQIKSFEEFGLDKAKSDGYATQCKVCRASKAKGKYQKESFKNANTFRAT